MLILQYKEGQGFLPELLATVDDGSFNGTARGIDVNPTTYDIAISSLYSGGTSNPEGMVLDQDGAVQWARRFGGSNYNLVAKYDSSGNIYFGTRKLTKVSSTGTELWSRELQDISQIYAVDFDSSGNVIAMGVGSNMGTGPIDGICMMKFSSTGTLLWQRYAGGNGFSLINSLNGTPMGLDSQGNIIAATNTVSALHIVKYTTDGTLLWQYRYSSENSGPTTVVCDSSDNIYIGVQNGRIMKLNSSGDIQWVKTCNRGISAMQFDSATGDAIFVLGGGNDAMIARFNSDLTTMQWANLFNLTAGGIGPAQTFNDGAFDARGNIYAAGFVELADGNDHQLLLFRVPNDGTGTGSYTDSGFTLSYTSSSLSFSTITSYTRNTFAIESSNGSSTVNTDASGLTTRNYTSTIWT